MAGDKQSKDSHETVTNDCAKRDAACQTSEGDHGLKSSIAKHPTRHCITICEYEGKDPHRDSRKKTLCDWVRCCLCAHWFHPECVSLPQKETEGVWTCPFCRHISNDVSSLKQQVDVMLEIIRRNQHFIAELTSGQQEITNFIKKTTQLQDNVNSPQPERKSLLLGDSLTRDIQQSKDMLIVKPNISRLENIIQELKDFDELDQIYVVNGTNDCKCEEDLSVILDTYRTVIEDAKKKGKQVIISSIPPRTDDSGIQQKINEVNQRLMTLTKEEEVTFVNNDGNFTYNDKSVDERLLQQDGCHLSELGAQRLIKNLGLQDLAHCSLAPEAKNDQQQEPWSQVPSKKKRKSTAKTSKRDVHSPRKVSNAPEGNSTPNDKVSAMPICPAPPPPKKPPNPTRKVSFHGHQHPLSNFFPCQLDMYDRLFQSSEAAYQYRKAAEYEDWETAEEISKCPRAIEARRLGDKIQTDQQWWDIRKSVMMEIITAKAKQCPEFRNTLVASYGNSLIEDTTHEFWGRGRHHQGENTLGILLETLRSNLPPADRKPTQRYMTFKNVESPRGDPGCGFCGERGHNSDTCGHGRPIQCRHCHGYRHKEKSCWYKSP